MKNKIIVITGATKGLGKAMADIFKKKGATVIVSGKAGSACDMPADVSSESDVNYLAEQVIRKHGKIDMWINNAGIWLPKTPLEDVETEKAQKLFQTNFFGTFFGMKAAIRHMKKQKFGTIVNIASTTAFDGMSGSSGSVYSASKYAIRGLTNCVREELKDQNISVIGVYPGGFKTDLFNAAIPDNFNDFMTVESVAEKIIKNLEKENPDEQLIIKRPGQKEIHEIII